MTDALQMPIADSNSNGGGLLPAANTRQPKTRNAVPDSNVGLAGPIVISTWAKNGRETLQVRLDTFKGQPVIDARAWYIGSDGELKPGRGGFTVSVKHLPDLAAALAKALDVAKAHGLIAGEGGGA